MPQIKRNKKQIYEDLVSKSKICAVCNERKSFDLFYNFKNKNDGKSYRCKSCDNLARAKYIETNKVKAQISQRNRNLKFKYNITPEDYEELLRKQSECCAICKSKYTRNIGKTKDSFSVDHDHSTGKVRGLLCNNCNRGLGLLGDTKESLQLALDYLNETH